VYDLGCGEAPYRDWILKRAEKYVGVDWGASQHEVKADLLADLSKHLPIESAAADTVVAISVLEHLCEPRVFLSEAYRLLKGGGTLVLQVPFMWGIHEAPHDFFRYTSFGLEYLLKVTGFSKISVIPQTGYWTTVALKFNYQTLRLIRGPGWVRKIIGGFLHIIWGLNQSFARKADVYWPSEGETAGYVVFAVKN